ncbi:poly [ADP-ribose] polymerase 2-like [Paramacrobiotus metropolitanus]|uniref:poly [ADP-ribose] polymerase 2-like n=1 Tax=Paramacrobiotus metropolitanus TaxID=2943436 RepID=UPI002446009A|nr:poly [ADP-ribose] polymerase 2-like [Paramacrobiotus metropolitanus]
MAPPSGTTANRRGRPAKIATSSINPIDIAAQTTDDTASNNGRPKRTRAMKNQQTAGTRQDVVVSQPVPAPTKKRGRPPATKTIGNGASQDSNGTGSSVTVGSHPGASQSDDDSGSNAPKKRVRTAKSAKTNGIGASQPAAMVHTSAAPSQSTVASSKNVKPDPDDDDDDQKPTSSKPMKQMTIKGRAPVDELFQNRDSVHVYCEGDDVWDVALNQTSIDNNNNKFYMIQLLEHDHRKEYFVFNHWGRVGLAGQSSSASYAANLESAKQDFKKKFKDKTKNDWEDRAEFVKVPGKYDLVLRDYNAKDEPAGRDAPDTITRNMADYKVPDSKLDERVQVVVKTIFNIRMMEQTVKEMKYDAKKAPLGRLTEAQVKSGYLCLKKLEELITKGHSFSRQINEASSEYYTKIPHDFGMHRPPPITSLDAVKQELALLETLGDIEIAMRALEKGRDSVGPPENPMDIHYRTLKTDIKAMDRDAEMFSTIQEYLLRTHGPSHSEYQLQLLDVFELQKDSQFTDVGNRMLLWHGSRLSNFVGILSQGLRIAPPEAPVTGYMFGKGIYFADVSSKSANYCYAQQSDSVGFMLLCEVALGQSRELRDADYSADQLPTGFSSTKGVGSYVPDQSTYRTVDNMVVPVGKCVDHASAKARFSSLALQYNEYIVYNVNQVRMRYLVQVKFNYKRRR